LTSCIPLQGNDLHARIFFKKPLDNGGGLCYNSGMNETNLSEKVKAIREKRKVRKWKTLAKLRKSLPKVSETISEKPKKPRKAVRKVSSKRAAYLASDARKDGLANMAFVKSLPCLVCGCYGVEVHHLPHPRDDLRTIPLCPRHHRREYGPGAYHYSRSAFNEAYGLDDALLARVDAMIAAL